MTRRWAPTAIAVVGLVALHLVLSRSMDGFLLADGTGYLANARWIVGKAGTTWQGPGAFYHAGWSLVVAPIYLFTRSPSVVHSSVLVVNAALASLSFVACAALARRAFGLDARTSILAGLVAATYPAVLLQASFEWSESLFHLLFPLLLLSLLWLVQSPSILSSAATGVLAAALNATHPKGLGVVVAIGIAFVALGWRELVPRRVAASGLAALAIAFVATRLLHGALQDALYAKSAAAIEGDVLERITDPGLVWGSFKRLWGQLWYLTVASVGLFPLGVVTLARHRDRRFAVTTLGCCLAILAASCLQMSDGTRVDHLVYGRYDEGFLPALLVAAGAGLVAHRRQLLRFAAAGAVLSIAFAVMTVVLNGPDRFTGDVMPLNVVGVLVYRFDTDEVNVLAVTALALLPLIVVALCSRRSAALGMAVVVAFFATSSLSVEARTLRPWEDFWTETTEIPEVVHRLGIDEAIRYAADDGYDYDAIDLYQLELTDTPGLVRGEEPSDGFVIAPASSTARSDRRMVFSELGVHHLALWALGERIAPLERRGFVLPSQTSAPLPPSARRATISVTGSGARRTVHIRKDGGGSPWLPIGAIRGVVEGTVRLGVRWYDGDREVTTQTYELPRMVLPDDEVDIAIDLDVDVPPGSYRVVVSLRQELVSWWDESAVTLEVDRL